MTIHYKGVSMKINQVSAVITQENEDLVIQNLTACTETLDFLISLTTDEKSRMAKMSRKALDFVERGLMYAADNPEYIPSYTSLEEYQKDVSLAKRLDRIYAAAISFCEKVKDTKMTVDAESYAIARLYYGSVKTAAKQGVPGTPQIYKDLMYHYKKSKNGKDETDNTPVTENESFNTVSVKEVDGSE